MGIAWYFFASCRNDMIEYKKKGQAFQTLSKTFSPYLNYYADSSKCTPVVAANPYIKGKLLVVDCLPGTSNDQKEMPGLLQALGKDAWVELNRNVTESLPEELLAKSKSEVGTIIQLRWSQQQVGSYRLSNGSIIPGYKILCNVTVIDEVNKLVAGSTTLVGADPPKAKHAHDLPYGMDPDAEIIKYIMSLPKI